MFWVAKYINVTANMERQISTDFFVPQIQNSHSNCNHNNQLTIAT